MKPIQLHHKQIEALANGATALLFAIDEKVTKIKDGRIEWETETKDDDWTHDQPIENFIECYSPLQVGNEYYVQEEFFIDFENDVLYKIDYKTFEGKIKFHWKPASKMTYKQSRFKFDAIVGEVKRVQELTHIERVSLCPSCDHFDFITWFDSINGQGTYESNPYCFYAVIKQKG